MKLNVEEILQKDVTRTEFLGLIGAGVLTMNGITALLKNLNDLFGKSSSKQNNVDYGSSTYGGSPQKNNFLGL